MGYQAVKYGNKKAFLEEAIKRYYIRFSRSFPSETMTMDTSGGSYQSGGNPSSIPAHASSPPVLSKEEAAATHVVEMKAIPVPEKDSPKIAPPEPVVEEAIDLRLRWRINISAQITTVHHGQETIHNGSILTNDFQNKEFRVQEQDNPMIVADLVGNDVLEEVFDMILRGVNLNPSSHDYHPKGDILAIETVLPGPDEDVPKEYIKLNSSDFINHIANNESNRNDLNQTLYRSINEWLVKVEGGGTIENAFSINQNEYNTLYKSWRERYAKFNSPESWGKKNISSVFDLEMVYVILIRDLGIDEWQNVNNTDEDVNSEGKIGILHMRLNKVELEVMLDEVE